MKIKEAIINAITGEEVITERTLTAEEEKEILDYRAKSAQQTAELQAKAEAKAVAQAKLAALGLTVEDLTALGLGSN